ncbi:MAG TPA: Holliday junction resolvase [Dehalococcoidia bacterium]|nr:Holliday junction resolvase [Dehalococcoidia bacterium]
MDIVAVIVIAAVAAIFVVILFHHAIRIKFERQFQEWCDEKIEEWEAETEQARKAAISQSRAVLGGKFTEQMVPYFPDFRYDPTEARFIGSPVDMIVFPGLSHGDPEEIVILEVKTGPSSQLTAAQKKIRQLIEEGMVRWDEIHRISEAEVEGEDEQVG